jgi:hypothetical protein
MDGCSAFQVAGSWRPSVRACLTSMTLGANSERLDYSDLIVRYRLCAARVRTSRSITTPPSVLV